MLAAWGALTGTVTWIIGTRNFFMDRPRLRMYRASLTEQEGKKVLGVLVTTGGGRYELVEVVNVGRRAVSIYHPELWVAEENGLLNYESADYVFADGKWNHVEDHWQLYSLAEGATVTFAFRLGLNDRFVRVDIADSVRRFWHIRTVRGDVRWLIGRLKKPRQWNSLRDAFFAKSRPRHHKKD
jgi:hypothetical protein